MEPKEIKEVVDVLIKGANGKIPNFKEEEAIAFEKKAIEVISQVNNDLIIADIYELGEENLKYGMYLFTDLFWDKIKKKGL